MNKETQAYYKMLRAMLEINDPKATGASPVGMINFLDEFNKYWKKYYAKEFRASHDRS